MHREAQSPTLQTTPLIYYTMVMRTGAFLNPGNLSGIQRGESTMDEILAWIRSKAIADAYPHTKHELPITKLIMQIPTEVY